MYFKEEDLAKLFDQLKTVTKKRARLTEQFVSRTFKNADAGEYARHGYARRLKTLDRSIAIVFRILPPDRTDIPSGDELADATINIQASIFNVFASLDNLAWILVRERNLAKEDGSALPNAWVGLGPGNTELRKNLSEEFRVYLEGMKDWFEHLEDFRHALAHRIPLYIPPYFVDPRDEKRYQEIEEQKALASNMEQYQALTSEQMALAQFRPVMVHSLNQDSKLVVFHAQLLADFNTVIELGERMIQELDRDTVAKEAIA